jgi:glutamine amidotransferase
MQPRIAIVALGAANTRSIGTAIMRAGGCPYFVDASDAIPAAHGVVIPGVANVGYLADALDRRSLRGPILAAIRNGKPCLGICAGFQLLFDGSDESPKTACLGLFAGVVRRLAGPKSPHIGWNLVNPIDANSSKNWAYFAHSYAVPADVPDATALTRYGDEFVSTATRGHVIGVQFHPERSGRYGAELLQRFVQRAASYVG